MLDLDLKNAKIQIVDDQEANNILLEEFLISQGFFNIATTTDPMEAISLFKSFEPDLVLLDLLMPQMSGYEVLEQLHQLIDKDTYCPVLVLTADMSTSARQRSLARGAKDYISKPFDLIEVLFRIRNVLETRYLYQQLRQKNLLLEGKVDMFLNLLKG